MTDAEANRFLDLKKELEIANAILEVLKAKGFESEIMYIKNEIKNNL